MKALYRRLSFTFFIAFYSKIIFAQQIVLIDKQFTWQSYLCDSLTSEKIDGFFPINALELDTLILKLEPLKNLTKFGLERKYIDETKFSSTTIKFKIKNVPSSYGDNYDIEIISCIQNFQFHLWLASSEWGASASTRTIKTFRKYLLRIKKQLELNKLKHNCSPK